MISAAFVTSENTSKCFMCLVESFLDPDLSSIIRFAIPPRKLSDPSSSGPNVMVYSMSSVLVNSQPALYPTRTALSLKRTVTLPTETHIILTLLYWLIGVIFSFFSLLNVVTSSRTPKQILIIANICS